MGSPETRFTYLDGLAPMFDTVPTTAVSNTTTGNRSNRICPGKLDKRTIDRWFDASAFTIQPQYTYGNSGRNILFGPDLRNLDLSLHKNFQITENMRVQFRAESFNFTNTPAFGQPGATINGLGVGQITSASDPRRLQFGLKFIM